MRHRQLGAAGTPKRLVNEGWLSEGGHGAVSEGGLPYPGGGCLIRGGLILPKVTTPVQSMGNGWRRRLGVGAWFGGGGLGAGELILPEAPTPVQVWVGLWDVGYWFGVGGLTGCRQPLILSKVTTPVQSSGATLPYAGGLPYQRGGLPYLGGGCYPRGGLVYQTFRSTRSESWRIVAMLQFGLGQVQWQSNRSIKQSKNQSKNRRINQTIEQSIDRSNNEAINRQSIKQQVRRPSLSGRAC